MRTNYSDTGSGGTGWSLVAVTDSAGRPERGGLVLKDIRHSGHNLAQDLRVVRVWLTVEVLDAAGRVTGNELRSFFLEHGGLFTASAVQERRPTATAQRGGTRVNVLSETLEALDFRTYFLNTAGHAGYSLRVDYTGHAGMFSGLENFEFERIDLSQIFLFSHLGSSPPHEPGGALPAARLHPLLKYTLHANTAWDTRRAHRRLASIRFDYRLHLKLDALHSTTNATPPHGNNAGLFRDAEQPSLLWGASMMLGLSGSEDVVFDSVEKPVVMEVVAPGLAKGAAKYPPGPVGERMNSFPPLDKCWDNIHWWGGGVGANIISSPGAFHAAHIHWRWGRIGSFAPQGGNAVFGPGGAPQPIRDGYFDAWGALVDPRIWTQTLRLGVVLNDASLDPDRGARLEDLSRADWKTLFTGLRARPSDIFEPRDIVLWYSTEVHRRVLVPSISTFTPPNYTTSAGGTFTTGTEGVVFVHGLFFAHGAEQQLDGIGSRNTQHWPDDPEDIRAAASWFRHA